MFYTDATGETVPASDEEDDDEVGGCASCVHFSFFLCAFCALVCGQHALLLPMRCVLHACTLGSVHIPGCTCTCCLKRTVRAQRMPWDGPAGAAVDSALAAVAKEFGTDVSVSLVAALAVQHLAWPQLVHVGLVMSWFGLLSWFWFWFVHYVSATQPSSCWPPCVCCGLTLTQVTQALGDCLRINPEQVRGGGCGVAGLSLPAWSTNLQKLWETPLTEHQDHIHT